MRRKDEREFLVVGKRIPRIDGAERAKGEVQFIGDIYFPGMLYGKLLRSKYSHAKILRIDTSKARKLPGVKAVVTASDAPDRKFHWLLADQTIFAQRKVRYWGQPVAAVAATDEEIAEEALELINVEYEELPAVFTIEEAMKPDAPLIHDEEELKSYKALVGDALIRYGNVCAHIKAHRGDVEKGFQQADYIFEDTFTTQSAYQAYLEPNGAVAKIDSEGKITVWANTQTPFPDCSELAYLFDLPITKVRVIASYVGGAFGGKNFLKVQPICVLLVQKTKRPVKVLLDQAEDLIDSRGRHATTSYVKTGVMKDGTIVARQFRVIYDTGAFAHEGPGVARVGLIGGTGAYNIPNLKAEAIVVYTNKMIAGAFRGYGIPQPTFASESQLDIIAEKLGIDPLEIRLKNAMEDGDPCLVDNVYDCGYKETLRLATQKASWKEKKVIKNRGRGLAGAFYPVGGFWSSAAVKINEDGSVSVASGKVDLGQGIKTVLQQIAAEELGVSMKDISVVVGDTEIAPFDTGVFGDTGTQDGGEAVRRAAADAKKQIIRYVAEKLEANVEDLELKNSRVFVKGSPEKGFSITEIARGRCYSKEGPILGRGSVAPPERAPGEIQGTNLLEGDPFPPRTCRYNFFSKVVDVKVDSETGMVELLRIISAQDCGQPINPMNVEGQVEGATTQGIGYALTEDIVFEKGKVINSSLLDYKIPTALDVPPIETNIAHRVEALGPFGAKGYAEVPIVAIAPAIANAIYDAIGLRIKDLPITPEKILKGLEKKRG